MNDGRAGHSKAVSNACVTVGQIQTCVILQREQEVAKLVEGRDVAWHTFQYGVTPAECVPVEGNHPAYIL